MRNAVKEKIEWIFMLEKLRELCVEFGKMQVKVVSEKWYSGGYDGKIQRRFGGFEF